MERILIAGCGDLGTRLGRLLAADGHRVWGLRRDPLGLPSALEPLAADLTRPDTLGALPAGLTLVFYTAAAADRSEAAYRRAYEDGPRNLLAALAAQGQSPRRVVYCSSTAVYGQEDGGWVDEGSPTRPQGYTGQRVLAGEGWVAGGPYPATTVRLAGIYGPGRTRLLEQVRRGETRRPEGLPVYTNRIHSDDAAAALAFVARLPAPRRLYLAVDDEPVDRATLLLELAGMIGAPPPPSGPAEPGRGGNKRCSNRRLKAAGFRFRYPTFREGYRALAGELGLLGGGAASPHS
jgi:nucleoside-diphosphate-sugar epimerase